MVNHFEDLELHLLQYVGARGSSSFISAEHRAVYSLNKHALRHLKTYYIC